MFEYNEQTVRSVICDTQNAIEPELEKIYEPDTGLAGVLYEAERYSLLAGGKRVRPALVIETCKLLGGAVEAALPYACAIEMVHTYSLIHDDLPCMDNDDLRRGRPTNHKVYGEAFATLAGDGLLTDSFSVIVKNRYTSPEINARAVEVLSVAAGSLGMIKGQVIDILGESNKLDKESLLELHRGKTGALIMGAVRLGVLASGCSLEDERAVRLVGFAERIGLVFQVIDDILDATSSSEVLGKSHSDLCNNKTTFLNFYSIEGARKYANELTEEAIGLICDIDGSKRLSDFAKYLCDRIK